MAKGGEGDKAAASKIRTLHAIYQLFSLFFDDIILNT